MPTYYGWMTPIAFDFKARPGTRFVGFLGMLRAKTQIILGILGEGKCEPATVAVQSPELGLAHEKKFLEKFVERPPAAHGLLCGVTAS